MDSHLTKEDTLNVRTSRNFWKKLENGVEEASSTGNRLEHGSQTDTRAAQCHVVSNKAEKHTRIVLFGKTGVGKSATCNRIMGKTCCEEKRSLASVTTECNRNTATLADGRKVTVVDTPGLFDTHRSQEETTKSITDCIELCFPGPHVFLLVLSCNSRYTEEEHNTLMEFKSLFGERIYQHTIVLFTNLHSLGETTIEEFQKTFPARLQEIIKSCEDRMLYVENKEAKAADKCYTELFRMIDDLVAKSGHYTDEKFNKEHIERELKKRMEEQNIAIRTYTLGIKQLEAAKIEAEKQKKIDQQLLEEIKKETEKLKKKAQQKENCFIL